MEKCHVESIINCTWHSMNSRFWILYWCCPETSIALHRNSALRRGRLGPFYWRLILREQLTVSERGQWTERPYGMARELCVCPQVALRTPICHWQVRCWGQWHCPTYALRSNKETSRPGQVPLVVKLAEDFTYYMAVSEQTASCIQLSVLVSMSLWLSLVVFMIQ